MTKTTTLIASCCFALLAMPAAGLACDKDKTSGCSEAKTKVMQVKSEKGSCDTKDARALINIARMSQNCTSSKGVANVKSASDCESACPKEKTVAMLMSSLKSGCSEACAKKADVVAALRMMSTYEKGLVCEKTLDQVVANMRTVGLKACDPGACDSSKTVRAALSDCSGKGAANVVTAGGKDCDPAACSKPAAQVVKGDCGSKGASKVIAAGQGSCDSKAANTTVVKGDCGSKGAASIVAVGQGSGCCASKAANTKVVKGDCGSKGAANIVTAGQGCDPAACSKPATQVVKGDCGSKGASKIVAAGQGSGCCASKSGKKQVVNANMTTVGGSCDASKACDASTKYVAYGCDKTDRIARAAAKAYLAMMSELKDMSGADGCSIDAAKQVLAAMINNMERDSKTEIAAVSFGAVSDKKSGSGCGSN